MMQYNFDEIIDRRNTDAVKFELCFNMFGTSDIQPMWVADMDFRTPDFIIEAITTRLKHPVLGYTVLPNDFKKVVCNWQKKQHNWQIDENWMGFLSGIVPGLSFSVQLFSEPGDNVIIQPPVYHPFIHVVKKNNRNLVYNPLIEKNGRFEMDFADLKNKITKKTKLLILCNPHNPGGRVWEAETLNQLAEICFEHNITVISDEIHADMVLPGHCNHTPFAKVSEKAANISVTFMAPSKTFNMPGLLTSVYIIPNSEIRTKFQSFLDRNEIMSGNLFAYIATIAAYEKGNDWRIQMLEYVKGNIDFVTDFLKTNIPQIKPMQPEASFLVWLDCSGLELSADKLLDLFINKAKLGLNDGRMFGPGGQNHMRLNVACPRKILAQSLENLKKAIEK